MYIVFQIEENGRFYAWVQRINESDNILSYMRGKNILTANIISTKKRAVAIVDAWTQEYKKQDRYLFDLPF